MRSCIRGTHVVAGVLAVHAALLAWLAWVYSPTDGEQHYVPAGVVHWRLARFEPSCRNPPLPRLLAALPILPFCNDEPCQVPLVDIYTNNRAIDVSQIMGDDLGRRRWLYFLSRLGSIALSVLGGAVCYQWAQHWFGQRAGIAALLMWCFSPNILANNALVLPDGPAASFAVLASYSFWQWARAPTWGTALVSGVALGAAWASKATWLVLLALWPALWLLSIISSARAERFVARRVFQFLVMMATSLWFVNALYGFQGTFTLLGHYRFFSQLLSGEPVEVRLEKANVREPGGNRLADMGLGWLPVPFPKLYVLGLDVQLCESESRRLSYMFGQWSKDGWWYYYFAMALAKMPTGTFLLLIVTIIKVVGESRWRRNWQDEVFLWGPIIGMLVLLIHQSSISRHFRYAIAVAPFIYISMGRLTNGCSPRSLGQNLFWTLIAWSVVSSLAVYPHSIAYVNEIAGRPRNAFRLVGAHNYDRRQDAYYVEQWRRAHPEALPFYAANETLLFSWDSRFAPERLPAGWHAVSGQMLYDRQGHPTCWHAFAPTAWVTYSTWIYHVHNTTVSNGDDHIPVGR